MWAVLSDIHGNLEALDAVLADLANFPVSRIFCLGDVLGYGPNPVECLERAIAFDVTLLGNFDQATVGEPDGFCEGALKSVYWTQSALEASVRGDLWEFLTVMPRSHREGDFQFVHGSPRNCTHKFVFPEDIYNTRKMDRIGELVERYCLAGHTHIPGVFTAPETDAGEWQFRSPEECGGSYRLTASKAIINVGSVGQPRDGDWRACYVLVDGGVITWRRVEYDWQTTRAKIYAIPELADFHGDRLGEGR